MSDPHVEEVGRIEDGGGWDVVVGTYLGKVTVRTTRARGPVTLTQAQAEEFAQLFVRACWEAARQDGAP